MASKAELESKFADKINKRNAILQKDYHPIFASVEMTNMVVGEEIQDDEWSIIKVPNGWIVKRLKFQTVFIPEYTI